MTAERMRCGSVACRVGSLPARRSASLSIHIGLVRLHSDACPSISGTHWAGPMPFSSLRCCSGSAIPSHLHTPLPLCLRAALSEFATRNVLIYLPFSIHLSLVVSCVLPSRLTPFCPGRSPRQVSLHCPPPIAVPHVPHGLPNLSALRVSHAAG